LLRSWIGAARSQKPILNPPHHRGRLAAARRAAVFALGLGAALSHGPAVAAGDAARGEALAKQWCAACHIVAADQARGADNVPPFATIATMKGFSAGNVAQFLMDPHPKMPDMQLSRSEAQDLGAYIASLGSK